jgi:tetratricopeptide (TPR) repeat protein
MMTGKLLAFGLLLLFQGKAATPKGVDLALAGHCPEAMPELDAAMRDPSVSDGDKRTVSTAGVRCSMLLNQQNDAMSFLGWLQQKYPADPEILFLAAHVFSDLSQRNAQELLKSAPESPLVIQWNAETFEKRGDLAKAIAEYRVLLARVPDRPGVHYRIGGLLMLQQTEEAAMQARKEFEAELLLNPRNASAEFYLGQLSSQTNAPLDAIAHYRRATAIYPGFAEAFAGLGRALLDSGKTAEAIEPLERAATLAPADPAIHQSLATAYQRSGRKTDAAREFALQKTTAAAINDNVKTLRKTVSGVPAAK